jgi:hypothetical protein
MIKESVDHFGIDQNMQVIAVIKSGALYDYYVPEGIHLSLVYIDDIKAGGTLDCDDFNALRFIGCVNDVAEFTNLADSLEKEGRICDE